MTVLRYIARLIDALLPRQDDMEQQPVRVRADTRRQRFPHQR